LLSGKSLSRFGAKKGAWAVVTGASDGIGREFAIQLAKGGFNIILVARNPTKLGEVASAIAEKSAGVQTKIVTVDFAARDEAAFKTLESEVSGLDIGVLINNVGKSHEMPVDFVETTQQEIDDILTVNINGTLRTTSIVLPGMISRKRGLIINVGSFSGAVASPMLATYSGSKAFLQTFSDALAAEVAPKGVTVQCLNTYFVVSSMSKIRKATPLIPMPSAYVRSALARIGLQGGAYGTGRPSALTPYPGHALIDWAMNTFGWKGLWISYTHNLHKDIRKRALKKKEREAKRET
jgi:17beta-estradiol 17-dehydrogenase / very-long-chain 3-oxoacyl-CoA reductase